MMRSVLVALVVLVTLARAAVAQSPGPDTVTEPRSGLRFPVSLIPPGGTTPHRITGTAIRQRTIFRVMIYAFGLYVDPDGARTVLAPFAGVPAATLARDAAFYRRLLDLDVALTLRLVLTRPVEGPVLAPAFADAVQPRLARMVTDTTRAGEVAALARFRAYFDVDAVALGTEIVFSCGPAGRLATSVGGDVRPPIDSRALCRALFDVYLGEPPVSRDAKTRLIAEFPGLLAAESESRPD